MADLHIDDFYRDCALALNLLYQAFPRKATIFVEDIIGHDEPDEFGLHSRRHQACFATLLWLESEGALRFEALIRQEAIDQAVLTGRMFTLLTAPGPVSGEHIPVARIDTIRRALRAQSSTAVERVMRELMASATNAAVSR